MNPALQIAVHPAPLADQPLRHRFAVLVLGGTGGAQLSAGVARTSEAAWAEVAQFIQRARDGQ